MIKGSETLNIGPPAELPDGLPFQDQDPLAPGNRSPLTKTFYPRIAAESVALDTVAAAILDSSGYREAPAKRLLETAASVSNLFNGEPDEAHAEAHELYEVHKRVSGSYGGVTYDANDGAAQVWVLSSVHKQIQHGRASLGEKVDDEDLWGNLRAVGSLIGTPDTILPNNSKDVDTFRDEMFANGMVLGHEWSRDLVRKVVGIEVEGVRPAVKSIASAVTKTGIDERILDLTGLDISSHEERVAARVHASLGALNILPNGILRIPLVAGVKLMEVVRATKDFGGPKATA